jgi:membrane fusion protein (multidrug efflux system)
MANPRRLIGIAVTLAVIGALGFTGWTKVKGINAKKADTTTAAGKAPAPARPDSVGQQFGAGAAIPVVGAEVKRAPLIIWVKAPGQAAASQQIVVGAEAGGRIDRVYFKENDVVRIGDTLVMMDTTELVFALQQARNSVEKAKVSLRNTLISDARIADAEIRKSREAAARMSSGLVDAELSLKRATIEYAKAATRAPMSGRVANVKVVAGQRIGTGGEVMTVAAMDPISIEVQVMQSELSKLRRGNHARLVFASRSDTSYTGTISMINPMVDPSYRTARVTVSVRNPEGTIFPGMTASVDLQSQTYENRLLVPKAAVLQRSEGRDMLLVFTPDKEVPGEGTTDWRYVNIGLRNSEFYEIIPGVDGSQKMVEPGEIVLVEGHYTIEHQTRVKLVDKLSGNGGRPF